MSKNLNLLLQGPSSFSPSKISSLSAEIKLINDNSFIELNSFEFYSVDVSQDFNDHAKLFELLRVDEALNLPDFFIGPRSGTLSPWASKTIEIITNVGIEGVLSLEKYFGYFVNENIHIQDLDLSCLFDRMTQEVFMTDKDIASLGTTLERKPLIHIDISV
ncbi:MAG: phosphoribosylformylglycinamidine synthase, partial [SAR86 cluster bacterium]|nr:phosphoribosylformylglycinamidine synthase [SAR86 cluster bacterium]